MSYRGVTAKVVSAALAVTVLVSGLAPGVMETVSARKRSAALVQGFSNLSPIVITDGAQSTPSTVLVSGFQTEVADIDVTLTGLSHGQVNDVDVLLVGPSGQSSLLISDVGSSANNVTLTLDDQASRQVSSTGPLTSGTFQPTNFQAGDPFSPPAPTSPSGSRLGVFNSTDPNGIWTLYIKDDSPGTGGNLTGGWSLRITTANGVPDAAPDSFSVRAGKTLENAGRVLENDIDPDGDPLTAILAGQPTKGKVTLESDGSFTYRAKKKAKGVDSFTYLAQDPGGLSALGTVTIQITKARKKGK
jgi:subtilisin-like proprotein convertase family protein